MIRRTFLGKVLAFLGAGSVTAVAAPPVQCDKPRSPAPLSIPLVPYDQADLSIDQDFPVRSEQVDDFIRNALGGFDPAGEPNAFIDQVRAVEDGTVDGWQRWKAVHKRIPVGHFTHRPMLCDGFRFIFASAITGVSNDPETRIAKVRVRFTALPFEVTHLPQSA